jgi:hypothetical protein
MALQKARPGAINRQGALDDSNRKVEARAAKYYLKGSRGSRRTPWNPLGTLQMGKVS